MLISVSGFYVPIAHVRWVMLHTQLSKSIYMYCPGIFEQNNIVKDTHITFANLFFSKGGQRNFNFFKDELITNIP